MKDHSYFSAYCTSCGKQRYSRFEQLFFINTNYHLLFRVATSEEPTSLTALQRPTTVFSSSSDGEGSDEGEDKTAAAATSSGGGSASASPPAGGGQGRGGPEPPVAKSSAGKATVEYSWDGQPITRAQNAYISTNHQGEREGSPFLS